MRNKDGGPLVRDFRTGTKPGGSPKYSPAIKYPIEGLLWRDDQRRQIRARLGSGHGAKIHVHFGAAPNFHLLGFGQRLAITLNFGRENVMIALVRFHHRRHELALFGLLDHANAIGIQRRLGRKNDRDRRRVALNRRFRCLARGGRLYGRFGRRTGRVHRHHIARSSRHCWIHRCAVAVSSGGFLPVAEVIGVRTIARAIAAGKAVTHASHTAAASVGHAVAAGATIASGVAAATATIAAATATASVVPAMAAAVAAATATTATTRTTAASMTPPEQVRWGFGDRTIHGHHHHEAIHESILLTMWLRVFARLRQGTFGMRGISHQLFRIR